MLSSSDLKAIAARAALDDLEASLRRLTLPQRIRAREDLHMVSSLMPQMRDQVRGLELLCASIDQGQATAYRVRKGETQARERALRWLLETVVGGQNRVIDAPRPTPELQHGLLHLSEYIRHDVEATLKLLRAPQASAVRRQVPVAQRLLREVRLATTESQNLLERAADDFSGADLRNFDLTSIDLSWVRWDESTRWPTGWAARIRRMSVQQSPGLWVVMPANVDSSVGHLMDV
ncbi:hypothetical protein EAO76_26315 [Streptomyces sp. sk2.1]|nr:hypothetical protein EAO76_26315 [Streptomyces sp. sk2.1]